MKRISILVLCAVLLFALASCVVGEGGHQHTFGSEFKYNETHHWIGTTCEDAACADVVVAKTAHVDSDENKICDVCGYDAGHEHVYAEDYSHDADKHWRDVLCGHDVAVADEAAHTAGDNGICTVCGALTKVDLATVEDALALGKLWQSAVKWGESEKTYFDLVYSEEASVDETVIFDYDENYVHYVAGSNEYWIHLIDEDNILVIKDDGWDVSRVDFNISTAMIGGFEIDSAIIGGSESFVAYGPIQAIEELYKLGKSEAGFDYSESVADGKYTFTFKTVNAESYYRPLSIVTVEFTLGETYFIDSVSIKSVLYNAFIFDDDWNEIPNYVATPAVDGEGNEVVDEFGEVVYTYALDENSVASTEYTYTISQSTSEYDELPFAPDSILVSDYGLYKFDENYELVLVEKGAKLDVALGVDLHLFFDDVLPESADLGYNKFTTTVTDLDGNEVYGAKARVSTSDGMVTISVSEAGTYVLTISTESAEDYVLELTAVRPVVEYMELKQLVEETYSDPWGYENINYNTWGYFDGAATATCNLPFMFFAEFNSPYCNTEVTITVTDADGNTVSADDYVVNEGVSVQIGEVDEYGFGMVDSVASSIAFKNAGTYTVTVTSVENAECTGSFTVTAEAAEVRFGGTWLGTDSWSNQSLTIIIDEEAGTVTFDYAPMYGNPYNAVYTYSITDGVVTLTKDGEASLFDTLALDANGNPVSATCQGYDFTLAYSEAAGGDTETESGLSGIYYVMGEMFVLTFDNGTLTIADNNDGTYSGTYNYVEADGGVTVTNLDGSASEILISVDMGGNYSLQVPSLPMYMPMSK